LTLIFFLFGLIFANNFILFFSRYFPVGLRRYEDDLLIAV
jgi:hypothetical protein